LLLLFFSLGLTLTSSVFPCLYLYIYILPATALAVINVSSALTNSLTIFCTQVYLVFFSYCFSIRYTLYSSTILNLLWLHTLILLGFSFLQWVLSLLTITAVVYKP